MTRGAAWVGVALGLGMCALLGQGLPRDAIDWQPILAWTQPWRAFSAIGVHYNAAHLIGNLAGVALAGALGWVAQVPTRAALAWLAAWPLTHFGMLLRPDLPHYGGLSGVLHAGVAIVAVGLIATGTTRAQRVVGFAIVVGLMIKLLSEAPWGAALQPSAAWGIAVAPFAHLSGTLAGVVCALLARVARRSDPPRVDGDATPSPR